MLLATLEPISGISLATQSSRAAADTSWRVGFASSAALHVGVVASLVVGSWVWQWWLAGWWELIVPPPNANAVAAAPAQVLEVATYAPPQPMPNEIRISPSPQEPIPQDYAPAEPIEPRDVELSPQGDVAIQVVPELGETLEPAGAMLTDAPAETRPRRMPELPPVAADAPLQVPRQIAAERADIARDASAASLPMQGVEAPDLPRTIFSPAPVYPPALLAARIEGVVKLRVEVDAQGRVTSARVLASSGRSEFDAAAKDAVLQWRFAPSDPQQTAPRALAVPIRFGILAE